MEALLAIQGNRMRRRQQDLQPISQPQQDNDTPPRRAARRSPALLAGIIVIVIVIVVALLLVGIFILPLHENLSSLRGVRIRKSRRTIAVGDIHGDKDALARALQLANLVDTVDGTVTWIGGSDILVQIGDLLNKAEKRDEDTLSYFADIELQARAAGGIVAVTAGDHDLHNAPKLWKEMEQLKTDPFPSWMHAAYVVDRTLFVHGSLSKTVFDDAADDADAGSGGSFVERMNAAAEAWLAGKGEKPAWIGRGDGPIWSRLYSSDNASNEHPHHCDELTRLLNELSVDRMVIGHTVRREGISSICNGQAWRIDVGLSRTESRAGKIGASEVLELSNGGSVVNILSTDAKLPSWGK